MSIFNRISAIENKISSIEGRFTAEGTPGQGKAVPGVKNKSFTSPTVQKNAANFQNIISSLAGEDKFVPGAYDVPQASHVASSSGAPPKLSSASVQPYVKEAAEKYNLDPALIEAVIKQESAYDAGAESYVGAQGLMQLMPETAKELGVENSFDPRQNVMGGAKYLRQMMDQFDGNLTKVIAGYNAGPGAVSHYDGVPPYAETQGYVSKVLNNFEEFKS